MIVWCPRRYFTFRAANGRCRDHRVLFAMAAFVARKRHRDVPIRARRVASSELARLSMLLPGD